MKNITAILLLVPGAPMLLMGDEVRRTQFGNNNAYNQDNELSWFDWSLLQKHSDLRRFVSSLIQARLRSDVANEESVISLNQLLSQAKLTWHGMKLHQPDWSPDSHTIALTAHSFRNRFLLHFMINAYWEMLPFEVPSARDLAGQDWRRWIDTFLPSPDDLSNSWDEAAVVQQVVYNVQPRSIVVLFATIRNDGEI